MSNLTCAANGRRQVRVKESHLGKTQVINLWSEVSVSLQEKEDIHSLKIATNINSGPPLCQDQGSALGIGELNKTGQASAPRAPTLRAVTLPDFLARIQPQEKEAWPARVSFESGLTLKT